MTFLPSHDMNTEIKPKKVESLESTNMIKDLIHHTVNELLDCDPIVVDEISEHICSPPYISQLAQSIGFPDLLQVNKPSDELIAARFTLLLEYCLEENEATDF